jgi:hypothetical protein
VFWSCTWQILIQRVVGNKPAEGVLPLLGVIFLSSVCTVTPYPTRSVAIRVVLHYDNGWFLGSYCGVLAPSGQLLHCVQCSVIPSLQPHVQHTLKVLKLKTVKLESVFNTSAEQHVSSYLAIIGCIKLD